MWIRMRIVDHFILQFRSSMLHVPACVAVFCNWLRLRLGLPCHALSMSSVVVINFVRCLPCHLVVLCLVELGLVCTRSIV